MTDTIAAISTPYGRGGVALIRISGDEAIDIAAKVFFPKSGKALGDCKPRTAVYGSIVAGGKTIDDGIATVFRAPSSYTGEDCVEISCHGGILLSQKVLTALFEGGARVAEAGEFTRRAFVSGKLTLTEAEAVIDLIDAKTDDQIALARSQVSGRLSTRISEIYEDLRTLVSAAYVYADYPDEDLSDVTPDQMMSELVRILQKLDDLTKGYEGARIVREGISAVLVGRPNTGKSSVLNRLLGHERAIVSSVAGTTRDTIEESATIGRLLVRFIDTAGIHESEDEIERIGVGRSLEAIDSADLIIVVLDGSEHLSDADTSLLAKVFEKSVPKIALLNKCDLEGVVSSEELNRYPFDKVLSVSAKSGKGFELLPKLLEELFAMGLVDYDADVVVANARQNAAVMRASSAVKDAIAALQKGYTPDVAGLDIERAMEAIGQTDGRAVSSDIVNAIFHRFCVGK